MLRMKFRPENWPLTIEAIVCAVTLAIIWAFVAIAHGADQSQKPLSPADVMPLVAADQADINSRTPGSSLQRRYVWCPHASAKEYAAACMVANNVLTRTDVDVVPTVLADGKLVAFDFALLAPELSDQTKALKNWAELSDPEPFFHANVLINEHVKAFKWKDGRVYDRRWVRHRVAAPHLGPLAIDIERAAGNLTPETGSVCPVVSVGWMTRILLSASDDGLYFKFRGLVPEDLALKAKGITQDPPPTKLKDYLLSRGASLKQVDLSNSQEKAAIGRSNVTGKARAVVMFRGQGTRPSQGQGIIALTEDYLDADVAADDNPFRELLTTKKKFREALVQLSNGEIESTLWNDQDVLQSEAPAALVADHRIPEPHTRRLDAGIISCLRCHAPNNFYQPFDNEIAAMAAGPVGIYGDLHGADQGEQLRKLASLYSGDLTKVVALAQDDFAQHAFAVTGMKGPEYANAVADVFGEYWYPGVDAIQALYELGELPEAGDKTGVKTFRDKVPLLDADPIIGRYYVDMFSTVQKKRIGLINSRRQFETIYADLALRSASRIAGMRSEGTRWFLKVMN